MLNVDCRTVDASLPRRSLAVGDPVHSEDVSVIGDHLMGLHWVALFADHERLKEIVFTYVKINFCVLKPFVFVFCWDFATYFQFY